MFLMQTRTVSLVKIFSDRIRKRKKNGDTDRLFEKIISGIRPMEIQFSKEIRVLIRRDTVSTDGNFARSCDRQWEEDSA